MCFIVSLPLRVPGMISSYEVTKEIYNSVRVSQEDSQFESMMLHTQMIEDIRKNYDSVIMKHRAYIGNPWIGIMYSRRIAELEPILLRKQ